MNRKPLSSCFQRAGTLLLLAASLVSACGGHQDKTAAVAAAANAATVTPISPSAPTFKISPVSEQVASCEDKLRQQMKDKSLKLISVPSFVKEIATANDSVSKTDAIFYSLDKDTEVRSVGVEQSLTLSASASYSSIRYNLATAGALSSASLLFDIEIEDTSPVSDVVISQSFNVTDHCDLSLASTSKQIVSKVNLTDYTFLSDGIFADGGSEKNSDRFTLPVSATLDNLIPAPEDLTQLPNNSFAYMAKVGVLSIKRVAAPDLVLKEFGLKMTLAGQTVSLFSQGKVFTSAFYGKDTSLGISLTQRTKQRTWKVSKEIWDSISLGTSQVDDGLVRSIIGKDYFLTHNSIEVSTNKEVKYDHFSAYWNITSKLTDGVTQIQTSLLMENPNPVISDNPTPADLVSNETIQVELPQVQLIAQDILKKAPQDRTGQIQGILDYLSVHYGYDADMAKNNIIRPLTTEEALARGHGVCQHYAVIFTAVARALKIPTRIVSGYALSRPNTAISHAWVEAEVQPSVWRVIEPQNKDGLTQTKTRYYFPVMRAAFLEDRGVPLTDFMADEMSRTLTFSPAP